MDVERVTVTIRSVVGDDGPLTVQDGLRQVLEFFDLLAAAQDGPSKGVVSWNLVSITKNSPLTATAEAFSLEPTFNPVAIAHRAKTVVAEALTALIGGARAPDWMDEQVRTLAASFFGRSVSRVGRTDVRFAPDGPPIVITEKAARVALISLERTALDISAAEEDLSRSEYGAVEGEMTQATTFYGRPAIRIRERLTNGELTCVLTEELARRVGPSHSLGEVWIGPRVMVSGEILYKKDGQISRVYADDLDVISPKVIKIDDIAFANFTSGLSPGAYLERLWSRDDG